MKALDGHIVDVGAIDRPISQAQIDSAARHATEKGYGGIQFTCMGITVTVHRNGDLSHAAPLGKAPERKNPIPGTPRQDSTVPR